MSAEFNPATHVHAGVTYHAQPKTSLCLGCEFYEQDDLIAACLAAECFPDHRPDGKSIIWVKPEGDQQ